MDLTINIDKAGASLLREMWALDVAMYEQELRKVRANIAAIDKALSPIRQLKVRSTDPLSLREYTVTRLEPEYGPYVFECSCPSFQFKRGLDVNDWCKHIRKAQVTSDGWR